MKRTPLKRGTSDWINRRSYFKVNYDKLIAKQPKTIDYEKKVKAIKKVKKTQRAKKMALRKEIIKQYNLPNILCSRYGEGKNPTRTDILKGILWGVFAKWIRTRDIGVCISCGKFKTYEELQAGHFIPAGGNDVTLCFDEKNVNGECEGCNAFDSFHLVPMRKNLIKKYGIELVESLEERKDKKLAIKLDESWYVEKILYYHRNLSPSQFVNKLDI